MCRKVLTMASGGQHKISPRKFSEKIALINKKEAEGNVEFEAIIKEVQATRSLGAAAATTTVCGGHPSSGLTGSVDDEELEEVYRSLIQSVKGDESKAISNQFMQVAAPSTCRRMKRPCVNVFGYSAPTTHNQSMGFPSIAASSTTKSQPDMPYAQEEAQVASSCRARGTSFGSLTASSNYHLGIINAQNNLAPSSWQAPASSVAPNQNSDSAYLRPQCADKQFWQKSSSDPALHVQSHVQTQSQHQVVSSNQMISNSESILLISDTEHSATNHIQLSPVGPQTNNCYASSSAEHEQENVGPKVRCCLPPATATNYQQQPVAAPDLHYDPNVGKPLPGIKIYAIEEEQVQQFKQELKSQVFCCDDDQTARDSSLPDLANLQFASYVYDQPESFARPLELAEKWTSQCNSINADPFANTFCPTGGANILSASECGLTTSDHQFLSDATNSNATIMRSHSHNSIDYLSKQPKTTTAYQVNEIAPDCQAVQLRPDHWFDGPLAFADGNMQFAGSGTSLRAQLGSMSPINSPQSNMTSPQSGKNSPASTDYTSLVEANYLSQPHELIFQQPMQHNPNVMMNPQDLAGVAGCFGPSQSPSSLRRVHNKACRGSYSAQRPNDENSNTSACNNNNC